MKISSEVRIRPMALYNLEIYSENFYNVSHDQDNRTWLKGVIVSGCEAKRK